MIPNEITSGTPYGMYLICGMSDLARHLVRLIPNGTDVGPLKSYHIKSQICPVWSQSNQLWAQTDIPTTESINIRNVQSVSPPSGPGTMSVGAVLDAHRHDVWLRGLSHPHVGVIVTTVVHLWTCRITT